MVQKVEAIEAGVGPVNAGYERQLVKVICL